MCGTADTLEPGLGTCAEGKGGMVVIKMSV